jgi:hypothetical protein
MKMAMLSCAICCREVCDRANASFEAEVGHPGWRLKIVGSPERGHDKELRALAIALGLTRVSVERPDLSRCENHRLEDANAFVLSTLNENFGLTSRKPSLQERR